MGKLLDRLGKAAVQGGTQAIGFTIAARRTRTLALVVRTGDALGALDKTGVDGVIVEKAPGSGAQAAIGSTALHEGLDFVLLTPESDASLLLAPNVDRVLEVPVDIDDVALRALSAADVEAVAVRASGDHLATVAGVAKLRRILMTFGSPALVILDGAPDDATLRMVRDSGASGVVLSIDAKGATAALKQIEGLPPRRRPGRKPSEATLPAPPSEGH